MTISAERAARPSLGELIRHPPLLLAFGFGSGLAPYAPGTAGTLVGVLLHWMLVQVPQVVHVGAVALIAVVGIPVCASATRRMGVHDHSGIVWDEIAGYLLTMLFAPPGWVWMLAGFALFRLFDILKPWPIRWFDRNVHGGLGIMLDDLVAAVPSGVLLYVAHRLVAGQGW